MSRSKLVRRSLIAGVLVFLVLAATASLVRVDWPVESLRADLEQALSRRVELNGPVHLRLLPHPGFSLASVVIHDAPSISAEPVAYVSSVEIDLRLLALIRGRVEFSGLRLVRPSVNLVKSEAGTWNYRELLEGAFATDRAGSVALPKIEVRGGRLNFVFGRTKSVFYLQEADVDIERVSSGDEEAIAFQFEVEPSRTDRAAHGFGRLTGNGRFINNPEGEDWVRMVVRLERSSIPEVLRLLNGSGSGLSGFVASRAELEGPISSIRIRGALQLAELDQRLIRRPRPTGWALDYEGSLGLVGQDLRIETKNSEQPGPPVSVRLHLTDYLRRPSWSILVTADGLPLEGLPSVAREMGLPIPASLELAGSVSGGLSWNSGEDLRGRLGFEEATVSTPDGFRARIPAAEATFEDGDVWAGPFQVVAGTGGSAKVTAAYRNETAGLELSVETDAFEVEPFRNAWGSLTGIAPPPMLRLWEGGSWSGAFRYSADRDGAEIWSGKLTTANARLAVPGLSESILIRSASGDAIGRSLEFEGSARKCQFAGTLSRREKGNWPIHLSLRFDTVDAGELEALLAPTLHWRTGGFLARTLLLRTQAAPDWLLHRRLSGSYEIAALTGGGLTLGPAKGSFHWEDLLLRLTLESAPSAGAMLSGRMAISLRDGRPLYDINAELKKLAWSRGTLSVHGSLQTSGSGRQLLANASGSGEFAFRAPVEGPGLPQGRIDGCFELRPFGTTPALSLPCLTLRLAGKRYYGWGGRDASGALNLDLFDGLRHFIGSGTVNPWKISIKEKTENTLE